MLQTRMQPSMPAVNSKLAFSLCYCASEMLAAHRRGPVWPLSVRYGSSVAASGDEASINLRSSSGRLWAAEPPRD